MTTLTPVGPEYFQKQSCHTAGTRGGSLGAEDSVSHPWDEGDAEEIPR